MRLIVKFPTRNQQIVVLLAVLLSILLFENSFIPAANCFVLPTARRVSWTQRVKGNQGIFARYSSVVPNNGGSDEKDERRQQLQDLPGPEDTSEENIRSLFALFNNALAT